MLCIKKSYFLSIFALFAVLFGSFIFTSENVSAVSDLSVTSSTWSANDPVFPDCDSTCLSQYHYLTISVDSRPQDADLWFIYGNNLYLHVTFPNFNGLFDTGFTLIFPFNYSTFKFRHTKSTSSFTFTLSENYPYGSSCPECPTCPEVPDNPYDPKFDEIKQAILIIPATALVIYFFFCIYRMLLKGRE